MSDFDRKMVRFAEDIDDIARATHYAGWVSNIEDSASNEWGASLPNPENIKGQQIRRDAWSKTLMIGIALAKMLPGLDRPMPQAFEDGTTGLVWVHGNRGLALQILKDGYLWTQHDSTKKQTIRSDSLGDVAEAMRAIFGSALH